MLMLVEARQVRVGDVLVDQRQHEVRRVEFYSHGGFDFAVLGPYYYLADAVVKIDRAVYP